MTNILILMADEMATMGLGCYGSVVARTPALDALAERGVLFDAAYTPSPICVPARAAIATGRYLHEIGHWSSAEPYDGAVPGWGHRLIEDGREVVSIGKLHYRRREDPTGFTEQIMPTHVVGGIGWTKGLIRDVLPDYGHTEDMAREIGPGETDYLAHDRKVTAEAVGWLSDPLRRERPWCGFVSWFSPHYPLIAPEEFYRRFDPGQFESGPDAVPDHPILRQIAGFFSHDAHFTPETRGIARASYLALCAFIDVQVDRVLRALAAAGLERDTLVIFTSDHGEMLGNKGFWTKSTMYDDAVRVPLIVAGPGIEADFRDDPVSLIDLAPTICAAAELDYPGRGFSGRSLLDGAQPGRTVLSEYHDGGSPVGITMVRWERWKYVYYAQGHPPQLFDLTADAAEERDLAAARPEILAEGRRRMRAMLDPEDVDARAHADQARRIAELGGREAILAEPDWQFTPAGSG